MSRKPRQTARAPKSLAEKIEALRERRGRYEALLTELERSGESQISLTDPDSRAMAAHTRVAVDAKNKMIVDQEVTKVLLQICRRGAVNSLLAVIRLRLRTMTRSRSAELPCHWLESV